MGAVSLLADGVVDVDHAIVEPSVVQQFEVEPNDPVTHLGAVAVLLGATLLATVVPVRRAASVDPITTLKAE